MAAQYNRKLFELEFINRNLKAAIDDLLANLNSFIIIAADDEPERLAFHVGFHITACHNSRYSKETADKTACCTNLPDSDEVATDMIEILEIQAERLIKYSKCCRINNVPPAFEIDLTISAKA